MPATVTFLIQFKLNLYFYYANRAKNKNQPKHHVWLMFAFVYVFVDIEARPFLFARVQRCSINAKRFQAVNLKNTGIQSNWIDSTQYSNHKKYNGVVKKTHRDKNVYF